VPRAEAVALLQALRTTSGNATFVCDNWGVVRRYKYCTKKQAGNNGLLWNLIVKAREKRHSAGQGILEVVWIPSHTTFENALNKSYAPSFWIANQLADKLAGAAAERHQIDGLQCRSLADSTQLAYTVLCRLVGVMSHLADKAKLWVPWPRRSPGSPSMMSFLNLPRKPAML